MRLRTRKGFSPLHTAHNPRHGRNDDHRGREVAVAFFSSLQQGKECNSGELAKSALHESKGGN
jgi:hypothetical protein